jgi:ubiquitin carboxyl-terminal hydrolase 10
MAVPPEQLQPELPIPPPEPVSTSQPEQPFEVSNGEAPAISEPLEGPTEVVMEASEETPELITGNEAVVEAISEEPPADEGPAAEEPSPPIVAELPSSSSYTHTGTISTTENADRDESSTTEETADTDFKMWAIWSRRPHDPTHAPGIIISPRARPPPQVVEKAIDQRTPPPSPPSTPKAEKQNRRVQRKAPSDDSSSTAMSSVFGMVSSITTTEATETTPATSTAPDTPVVGSPISSHTSVSLSPEQKLSKVEAPQAEEPPKAPIPEKVEKEEGSVVSTSTTLPPVASVEETSTPGASTSTAPPPTTAPPPVKKSWASLLRTPASSGPSAASGSRGLPTSSVQGFSIPASASTSTIEPPAQQSQLLSFLQREPPTPATPPRIRPRGLINTGNMCFANTVLQVLLYAPRFYALFSELGKLLGGPALTSKGDSGRGTPLVDATIRFLHEFAPVDSGKDDPETSSKAKGKEVDRDRNDEEDAMDSFIPSYIYDAMKEKKRFDSMRVSFA